LRRVELLGDKEGRRFEVPRERRNEELVGEKEDRAV
jgi:hypothetical protein